MYRGTSFQFTVPPSGNSSLNLTLSVNWLLDYVREGTCCLETKSFITGTCINKSWIPGHIFLESGTYFRDRGKFLRMSTCQCRLKVRIHPSIYVTTAVCKGWWENFFENEGKCLETRFCLPGGDWWKSGWCPDQEKRIMGCGVLWEAVSRDELWRTMP